MEVVKKGDLRLRNFTSKRSVIQELMNKFNVDPADMRVFTGFDYEQELQQQKLSCKR